MSKKYIQPIPAPSIAFILNSLSEHAKLNESGHVHFSESYSDLNNAVADQYKFVPFTTLWQTDTDRPNNESINNLFEEMQDTLDMLYPMAIAFLVAIHFEHSTLQNYQDDMKQYFDDCAMSAYETFKNALLGLDEEMYHRIGSIAEIQKLIFTYCKGFSQSANIQAFHDLSNENDLELALDITHLSFRTLTWAMNLNDDFAVAPVSYLD